MEGNRESNNEMVGILNLLCNVEFGEKDIESTLEAIWQYYIRVKRHNYYIISQYIIRKYKNPKDEEIVSIISENLKLLIDRVKTKWEGCENHKKGSYNCAAIDAPKYKCDNVIVYEDSIIKTCSDYKALYRFILKLYDHIQLEFTRLSEIKRENERFEKINSDLKIQLKQTKESFEDIESEFIKVNGDFNNIKNDTKEMYLHIISILGVFATIVIAVFGGLNVINSITSAFLQGDITLYKTVLVTALCILYVIWVIFILLGMVRWFRCKAEPTKHIIIAFIVINVICIIGIVWSIYQSNNLAIKQEDVTSAIEVTRNMFASYVNVKL